jgi:hypothetical protein
MADDQVDISGMPDPTSIGLGQNAPVDISSMPHPSSIGLNATGDNHMYGTPDPNAMTGNVTAADVKRGASALTGLPRVAAVANPVTLAGAALAGGAGALSGAVGAAGEYVTGDPATASQRAAEDLQTGRQRLRDWSANVYKLAEYATSPITTSEGAKAADTLLGIPGQVGKDVNDRFVRPVVGDNAADTLGDIGQDLSIVAPGTGELLRAPATIEAGTAAARRAVVRATTPDTIPEGTTYDQAGNVQTPIAKVTPPVGKPVTGEYLRAQPNPVPPPEGTVAAAREPTPAAQTPPAPSPATAHPTTSPVPATPLAVRPSAGEIPPTGAATLPTADTAPLDMNLSPDERAIVREGVAARRAAETSEPPATPLGFTPGESGKGREAALRRAANAETPPGAPSPGDAQRGSTRLFNSPADEGPQETPNPAQQDERAGHMAAINQLSGGKLPEVRQSALSGDYNATGDDYQAKEVGSPSMRRQLASENDALHGATENVYNSIGSEFDNSVDSTTLGDRGRITRGAIQGIERHFDAATNGLYEQARATVGNNPIPKLQRVQDYLNDDSNFTNDAEIGLQRAAKQRLDRLWTTGDPAKNTPAGSVAAAERFREFINEKYSPQNGGVSKALKNATDMDVAEHGGPGLFQQARAMRTHSDQLLESPDGIRKLLTPTDSAGINHQIPEHKVMDYIADLPREQHQRVLDTLRAGAHLSPELAESSAGAIREIQAHTVSRMHAAATNADGSWNARKFYASADRYQRNMADTFKDRPDVTSNLKTINDAGNTLHMDKHYPGGAAQAERTGAGARVLEAGGGFVASLAHEIPGVGRMVGRSIEKATEKATGKLGEDSRESAVQKRIVPNGKQRGSVQLFNDDDSPAARVTDEFERRNPQLAPTGYLGRRVGKATAELYKDPGDPNTVHLEKFTADQPGQGHGSAALKQITDIADRHGANISLDAIPQGANKVSQERLTAYYQRHGFEPDGRSARSMTREPGATGGARLNIGLHQGTEGAPGFRKMSKQEATGAIESTGAKVTKSSVLTPEAHGVGEPTLVADTNRPLSAPEMQKVLAKTKQSAIPQRTGTGVESMHIAPGEEATAKAQGWDKFNPEYFRDHEPPQRYEVTHKGGSAGDRTTLADAQSLASRLQKMGANPEDVQIRDRSVRPPSGQRGSFSFQNDNALNRNTTSARGGQRGVGIEPRNERNERVANQQMGGKRPLSDEQNDILNRLSGGNQRDK